MNLNEKMEFDHVVYVDENGDVTDAENIWAPEVFGGATDEDIEILDNRPWKLLHGFTGQYSYNGPIMHPSEFIGGGLERHILNTPGYYAVVAVSDPADLDAGDYEPYGWAVAYLPSEES